MRNTSIASTCIRMMLRYKLRTFSMLLGSLIGVLALTLVVSTGRGIERKVMQTIQQNFSASTVLISNFSGMLSGGPREQGARLTLDDAEVLAARIPEVQAWDPIVLIASAQVRRDNSTTSVRVIGGSERAERVWNRSTTRGEFFEAAAVAHSAQVALVGETVVRNLFGDEDPIGSQILVGTVPLRVLGVLEPLGIDAHGMDRDNEILAPVSTVMHRLQNVDSLTGIKLLARTPQDVPAIGREVRLILRERHALAAGAPDDFTLTTPTEMTALVAQGKRVFFVFLPLSALLAMLAGAVVSAALMLLSVNQRCVEIGLRRAVGARARD
ncbi:MAG TPA: ABC transporter permease, partial [Polyangiaceae bacterium]|nr:ABC transporter permease [Polyangiaceae bacterium]